MDAKVGVLGVLGVLGVDVFAVLLDALFDEMGVVTAAVVEVEVVAVVEVGVEVGVAGVAGDDDREEEDELDNPPRFFFLSMLSFIGTVEPTDFTGVGESMMVGLGSLARLVGLFT